MIRRAADWLAVHPGTVAATVAAMLTAVAVAVLAPRLTSTGPVDRDVLARQRAETIAAALRDDLTTAVDTMPTWATARFDSADDGTFSGTVAVAGPTVCVGVKVSVGDRWVLSGDQSAVTVTGPVELAPDRCQRDAAR